MEARKPNRLAKEASPYLLQHAHNPVDWWAWGPDALAEAKRRDVPILLSIGYSACHWCHVMERESFESDTIAALMNEHFVCIKVDREERPDLDQIYQLVVQLMGKTGGWPLTVFLTPAQKPFYGGTYFPPEDRYGMPGFPKILEAIAEAYRERRDQVAEQADELTNAIAEIGRGKDGSDGDGKGEAYTPGPDLLDRAATALLRRFDETHGGFGRQPKFPNTMPLEILMRHAPSRGKARLQLESMRRGGIWDQLGGGFHRYSTDERWLVPHFEKMLYDNALLLRSYVDGFRVFGEPLFAQTAKEIAAYVAREMTDASGGFYASQDADSEGEEGKFFVWDITDVEQVLGKDTAETKSVLDTFGITLAGNFEDHGRPTFKTVLSEVKPMTDVVRAAMTKMFEAREKRPKPFRDEKILTSWSALMISSLADAGVALAEPSMLGAAERALDFLAAKLVVNGRAQRLTKDGLVKGPGFLDDHAYLVNAAIDVYEASGEGRHLEVARAVADATLAAFFEDSEGFFFTPKDAEALIARQKDPFDNAVPSGFSMMCRALLRLGSLVDAKYAAIAEKELVAIAPAAIANPFGYGQSLCELDRIVSGAVEIVLVGDRGDPRTRALAAEAFRAFLPNRTIAWGDGPLAEGKDAKDVPVAYVCRGRTCSLPVKTPEELRVVIGRSA